MQSERDPDVPPPRPRRRRRAVGQLLARFACFILALVGLLPLGIGALARSPYVASWAVRETSRLLAEYGVDASYAVSVSPWPLSLDVKNIRVESTDGGAPALEANKLSIQPRIFALLSGKLAIDQIEVDAPRIRLVLREGEIKNLALELPKTEKKE